MIKFLFTLLLIALLTQVTGCSKTQPQPTQPQPTAHTLTEENAQEAIQAWISDVYFSNTEIEVADMKRNNVTVSSIDKKSEDQAIARIFISLTSPSENDIVGDGSAYFNRQEAGKWILTSIRVSDLASGRARGQVDGLHVQVEDLLNPNELPLKANEAVSILLQEIRTPSVFLITNQEGFATHLPGKLRRVVRLKAQSAAISEILKIIDPPDANPGVRQRAIKSIRFFGGPEGAVAIPALTKAIRDSDSTVRRGAIATLKEVSPEPKSVLPSLFEALKDKDKGVRLDAAAAITEIEAENKR